MRKLFFFLAIICWTISLVFNLAALIFDYDISTQIYFWLLHIGVFVVWLPAVLVLRNNEELNELRRNNTLTNNIKLIKAIFHRNPKWLIAITFISCIYGFVNFSLFIFSNDGSPEFKNGQYILQNHGQIIKTITKSQYNYYSAQVARAFSGHWMAFYAIAALTLFQYRTTKESAKN